MWLDGRYEDFGVSAARFERPEQLDNIIIVENLPSFLTLPPMPRTLAVFGEGRASQTLSQSKWLAGARIFYWGDADPYGFNILCALRSEFSAVQSILMNWDVWTKFPNCRAPTRIPHFKEATPDASWQVLTADELAAAQETIRNTFVKDGALHGHGIEQEKIPYLDASGAIIRALSLGITG
jgi:hypothetical protein